MVAALDGNQASYRTLLAELRTRLLAFFGRRLSSALSASADDLVQETLLAIHTRRLTFDRAQRFSSWAYAIARYKLIDHLRRHRSHATVPIEDDSVLIGEETESGIAARLDVETLMADVPARQRELLRSVKIDGASIAEAAAAQGMTETAAKVSIHRTMKSLNRKVGGEAGDER
jgi:RNA polymerase sigma-70 factor (ECF subfamily)